jgi:hypothetical protein
MPDVGECTFSLAALQLERLQAIRRVHSSLEQLPAATARCSRSPELLQIHWRQSVSAKRVMCCRIANHARELTDISRSSSVSRSEARFSRRETRASAPPLTARANEDISKIGMEYKLQR